MDTRHMIFIISQPRSGSTLLQNLLSNNSYIATASESWLLLPFLGFMKPSVQQASYDSYFTLKAINRFKESISKKCDFDQLLQDFLIASYNCLSNEQTKYILDKTPRYYEIIDEIIRFFPEAKFIILKRHPLAVLHSIIYTWQSNTLTELLKYKRDILNAPFILQDFLDKHKQHPNITEIRYEDVVQHPEETMATLYNLLDLPYEQQVLDIQSNHKLNAMHGDVKIKKEKNVHDKSLEAWKNKLHQPWLKGFFTGYADYLSEEFLKEYGNYEAVDLNNSTHIFEYYKFLSQHKDTFSGKTLLKYYLFRLKSGHPSKKLLL